MKVPKQRRCLRSGRKADTAQMWLGWKQFTTEPTFNPQASMEQDLAVKQGRCLPVQRPKGGDMERASWVHVETLCSGLLNLHSKLLQGTILHCRHHMKTEFPILFCKQGSGWDQVLPVRCTGAGPQFKAQLSGVRSKARGLSLAGPDHGRGGGVCSGQVGAQPAPVVSC